MGNPELTVSVIIPALQEAQSITGAIRNARAAGAAEIIVADGGSSDGTPALAIDAGARVVRAPRGRGPQQMAGAAVARGDVLCFLHADGRLAPDAIAQIRGALRDDGVAGGNFAVRFGLSLHARLLASFYRTIRALGVYYGDSVIFCRRSAFQSVGGFPDYPIMEDLALARRLRKAGRTVCLAGPVYASPRRWEHGGIPQAWASWLVIQSLYFAGVSPHRLGRLYRHIR